MLTITDKQMEDFSAYMMNSFIKKTQNHLKKKFPLSTRLMTDEILRNIIIQGIDKAVGYNIIEREDVLPFIEYLVCLGENFDLDPANKWAFDILTNDEFEGSYKTELLISAKPLYCEG
jgi:hypothetical protein